MDADRKVGRHEGLEMGKPIRLGFKWPDMHRPDDRCELCGKNRGRKQHCIIDAPMARTVVCKPCGGSRKAYEIFKAKSAALEMQNLTARERDFLHRCLLAERFTSPPLPMQHPLTPEEIFALRRRGLVEWRNGHRVTDAGRAVLAAARLKAVER